MDNETLDARIESLGNKIARLDELADDDLTVRAEQQRLQAEYDFITRFLAR